MRDSLPNVIPETELLQARSHVILRVTDIQKPDNTKMSSKFWKRLEAATPDMLARDRSPWLQKLCGVSQSTVSRWRNGANCPTLDNTAPISDATGVCVQYLLRGTGPQSWLDPAPEEVARMIQILDALSEEDRAEVLKFAEFRAKG